jgi:hypothetical protein
MTPEILAHSAEKGQVSLESEKPRTDYGWFRVSSQIATPRKWGTRLLPGRKLVQQRPLLFLNPRNKER